MKKRVEKVETRRSHKRKEFVNTIKGYAIILGIGFMLGFMYSYLVVHRKQIEYYTMKIEQIETESKVGVVPDVSCKLDSTACKIKRVAEKYGMDWKLAVAISKHETGNYTSEAFKEKNNVGGMMCSSGLISYSTLDDGIEAFVSNLKYNYIDEGLDTIEKIQPKYCPIGAANDPKGLNKYWVGGVTKYYNELS